MRQITVELSHAGRAANDAQIKPANATALPALCSSEWLAMNVLFDWRITDIERTANDAKNKLHEVDSLRSDVGRLECALREARSETDGLRSELSATQERMTNLEQRLEEMANDKLCHGGQ